MLPKKFRFLVQNNSGGVMPNGAVIVQAYATDKNGATYEQPKVQLDWGEVPDGQSALTPEYDNTLELWHGAHLSISVLSTGSSDVVVYYQRSHDGVSWPNTAWDVLLVVPNPNWQAGPINDVEI